MRSTRRWGVAGTAGATLVVAAAISSAAAEQPAWQSVPDETVFVVRVPALASFVDALKARTKLGALVADENRWAELRKLLEEETGDDWKKLREAYEKIGVTTDELWKAAAGEIGYAGTLNGPEHRYVGLAWFHCGDDVAQKWLTALDQKLGEQEPGPDAVRRQDFDVAGRKVIQLTIPSTRPKHGKLGVQVGVSSTKGVEIDAGAEPGKKPGDPDVVELSRSYLLVSRRDDGLLAAHASVLLIDEEGKDRTTEAEAVLDVAREVFARSLQTPAGRGDDVVEQWRRTPGLNDALPEGETLLDVFLDLRRLVKLADYPENREFWNFAKAAGLDAVGPVGYRIALDGTILRSGMFAAMPAPRTGLQTLLEQPALKPEPAAWVNNSVVGYQHISCDLGRAYQFGSQLVRERLPRGAGSLDTLETQAQAFLQIDPATLLSALGKTHTILTYVPEVGETETALADDDPASRTATAFVWVQPDEAVWRRLMQLLAKASGRPILTEQGFTGMRYDEKSLSGGWFVGNGFMVLAIGKGVTEKVLANLRSTPRTDESLRGSSHALRAAELLPPTPSITYDLTDGAGLLNFANAVMKRAFDDPRDPEAAKLKRLWPTATELQGTIGVSVSTLSLENEGVVYRSILELHSP